LGNTPGSRRHFQCGENAPTAVGGYILLANRAKYELSGLADAETELNDRVYRLFNLTGDEVKLLQKEVEH
jgi:hypothetical protein